MMTDLGLSARVRVWTDSNTANAIASRRGLAKARHSELKHQWLLEVIKLGGIFDHPIGTSQKVCPSPPRPS